MGSTAEEATSNSSSNVFRTLKEGERILAPTRRPDGTLRKPIRIRAGYVPQEEVAIYQSKGALLRKSMPEVPPGYDPVADAKPKTKSARRNERKKEKKQQASVVSAESEKGKPSENAVNGQAAATESRAHEDQDISRVAQQMGSLTISTEGSVAVSSEQSQPETIDLDKRIRALKKKIRLTEAQESSLAGKEINPEQREKLAKMDTWRKELKDLEETKIASGS